MHFVVASGDAGVAGTHGDDCTNGGSDRHHHNTVFNPAMPASCPYVSSAGSTIITTGKIGDHEITTTRFSSGGGFSNTFVATDYQKSAVEK